MKRAARLAVALMVVVVLVAWAGGCNRTAQQTTPTGPIGPKGPGGVGGPGGPPMMSGAFTYVCPEHADQTSPTSAKCPTCEKPMKADTTQPVEYFCPTHPEVVQSEPGECSKCEGGVLLQARAAGMAPPGAGGDKAGPAPPSGDETDTPPEADEKTDAGTT